MCSDMNMPSNWDDVFNVDDRIGEDQLTLIKLRNNVSCCHDLSQRDKSTHHDNCKAFEGDCDHDMECQPGDYNLSIS